MDRPPGRRRFAPPGVRARPMAADLGQLPAHARRLRPKPGRERAAAAGRQREQSRADDERAGDGDRGVRHAFLRVHVASGAASAGDGRAVRVAARGRKGSDRFSEWQFAGRVPDPRRADVGTRLRPDGRLRSGARRRDLLSRRAVEVEFSAEPRLRRSVRAGSARTASRLRDGMPDRVTPTVLISTLVLPAAVFTLVYFPVVTHLARGLASPYAKADLRK